MNVEMIRARLSTEQEWAKRADGWWLQDHNLDVMNMARVMTEAQARLCTITAVPAKDKECRLIYHWDLEGELISFSTTTHEESILSIAALCPAADWIEREIHDYFGVHLIGREDVPPLVLRASDPPGIFQRNGHAGGSR